jgi:hypothetical protein
VSVSRGDIFRQLRGLQCTRSRHLLTLVILAAMEPADRASARREQLQLTLEHERGIMLVTRWIDVNSAAVLDRGRFISIRRFDQLISIRLRPPTAPPDQRRAAARARYRRQPQQFAISERKMPNARDQCAITSPTAFVQTHRVASAARPGHVARLASGAADRPLSSARASTT